MDGRIDEVSQVLEVRSSSGGSGVVGGGGGGGVGVTGSGVKGITRYGALDRWTMQIQTIHNTLAAKIA